MQALMRQFSIRTRMMGAIGVVLLLLTMILDLREEKSRAQAQAEASEKGGFLCGSPHKATGPFNYGANTSTSSGSSTSVTQKLTDASSSSKHFAAAASSSLSATDPSPRKERRRKALKSSLNRGMRTLHIYGPALALHVWIPDWFIFHDFLCILDRAHQMAVQMNWTESVPTFYQESDM